MDIGGVIGKLDNPMLGQALGFVMTEFNYDKTTGQGMFGTLMKQIQSAMKQPHFPNLSHVMTDLMSDGYAGPVFKGGITAAVAGWVLDAVDISPDIARIGRILKTLGFNAAFGAAAVVLLDDSTRSYSGTSQHSSGGFSSGWGGR